MSTPTLVLFVANVISSGSTDWYGPFIPPISALLGAAIGGASALVSASFSDRRKQRADDLRQWDSKLIEIYIEINAATLIFYNTWQFNEGDLNHLRKQLPEMENAVDLIANSVAVIEVIAPPCEEACRYLLERAKASMRDADNGIPMHDERLRSFQVAHAGLIESIRQRIRVS